MVTSEQALKIKAFKAEMNKKLVKDGHRPLILGSEIYVPPCQTSGILSLDVALGGGWANNRWIEVVGEASSSKTTTILHTIATNQALRDDYSVYWLASEPYNPDWAALNGIDNDRVVVDETNNMELGFQGVINAARSHSFDCIVIDSYPALIADAEADKTMEEFSMASGARRVGQFFRKITDSFTDDRPYIGFFVNQYRDNIGGYSPHGTPKTEPGGKAKNYNFYQRVKISRDDWVTESREGLGKVPVGQTTKYQITKNKQGAPQRTAAADMYFDYTEGGFKPGQYDAVKDIITMGVLFKVIERGGGGMFYYTPIGATERLGWKGRDVMVEAIRDNIELREEIMRLTLEIATNKD